MKYLVIAVLTLVICGFTLASCGNEPKKANETVAEKPQKRVATNALMERLYTNFHADPVTQAQKDENDLIDYAVDKGLDVTKTASGLYYIVHEKGVGPTYIKGQPCKAHYTGYNLEGKIFDSSYKRNQPLAFKVGQMIPGWNEALKLFNPGTKAQLLIPSSLAYGERGAGAGIPPNTPLVFDVELLPMTGTSK